MNRTLILITFTILLYTAATAHENDTLKRTFITGKFYKISNGRVVPLKNSTVCIKGTRIHSVSDELGFYTLDVTVIADTATSVVVSGYLDNYEAQEVILKEKIAGKKTVNFELQPAEAAVYVKPRKN
ncbi:MAG: hypothetical protein ACXVPQ_07340 [Bacteroidia bacterium]